MYIYLDANTISICNNIVFINTDILLLIKKLSEKLDIKVVLSPYWEKYLIKLDDDILPINEMGRNLLNQFNMYNIDIYDIISIESLDKCIVFKEEKNIKTLKLGEFIWK